MMTWGSLQWIQKHLTPVITKPKRSRALPVPMNTYLWSASAAFGTSCTKPTTSTMAPNSRDPTMTWSADICKELLDENGC